MVERPFAYNPYNRSPTESYGVTAIDELPLMAQSLVVTPLWPNGSGASRSLGAPQSRIGVGGGGGGGGGGRGSEGSPARG
jgi:hypothetical protein